MVVEKAAAEAELTLLVVSPSAILSKWAGESEKTLRAVFELGRSIQPTAIFLVGREQWDNALPMPHCLQRWRLANASGSAAAELPACRCCSASPALWVPCMGSLHGPLLRRPLHGSSSL